MQAHQDAASLLIKNVYSPLIEISGYKKSQSKKLYTFREHFESIIGNAEDKLQLVSISVAFIICSKKVHEIYITRFGWIPGVMKSL